MTGKIDTDRRLDRVRRSGWTGITMGAVALLACELPIVLAALGLGGLSAGAMALRPPPIVEKIALSVGLLGALTLIALILRKIVLRRRALK